MLQNEQALPGQILFLQNKQRLINKKKNIDQTKVNVLSAQIVQKR